MNLTENKNLLRIIGALALAGVPAMTLVGCDDNVDSAEDVGERIDDATDDAADAIDDAADDVGDAIDDTVDDMDNNPSTGG